MPMQMYENKSKRLNVLPDKISAAKDKYVAGNTQYCKEIGSV